MPEYTYVCDACGRKIELFFTLSAYQETIDCICSPSEKMRRSYQDDLAGLTNAVVKTDDELNTIGDLANRNRDKLSKDEKSHLNKKHNDYKDDYSGFKLPNGMTSMRQK